MKILVAYDGTLQSKKTLQYGISKARNTGGQVVALHVFPTGLFVDYDAGPLAQDVARRESAGQIEEAKGLIAEAGGDVRAQVISEEGEPEEEILRYAEKEHMDLILAPPRYKALTKSAPCPVYIIPGTILVPVDSTDTTLASAENIIDEARAMGSDVLLLGIIPVHLYGSEEQKELEKVRRSTSAALMKLKKALRAEGLKVSEGVRSGYPDEEILKAAEEHSVSLIMLPAGGRTPSELSKAAAILLDEPRRLKRPVFLLSSTGAV